MEESVKSVLIKSELFQALTGNCGIQHLVNTAAGIVGNPIGIRIGEESVSYLSPDMPKNAMMTEFSEKGPVFVSGEGEMHDSIYAPLEINAITIGYFCIAIRNGLFSESDMKIVELIRKVFELALKTDIGAIFLLQNNKTKLLQCLLNEGRSFLSTSALWEELGLQRNKPLQIIVADNSQHDTNSRANLQIKEKLGEVLDSDLYQIKNERIVFLCNYDLKEKKELITKQLTSLGLTAGVSYPFDRLEEVKDRYQQAIEAIEMGKAKPSYQCLHFYEDFVLQKIIGDQPFQNILHEFCHPAVRKIYNYDRKNNTCLLKTLEEYFSSGRNLGMTAERLSIHRNTILQRLNKISDLTSDYSLCADSLYYIYLSLLLLDL